MTSLYNANYIETMPFSDTVAQISVEIGTGQSWTIPGTNAVAYQAYFEFNQDSSVYVGLNVVPSGPSAGSVSTQPFVEFKPKKRYVRGGDVLHFSTPDSNAYFGVSLRQIQG
ncbi:MAG TPA: hypothetical protein VII94_03635 [Candidatus Saccharimonadales bacterium]